MANHVAISWDEVSNELEEVPFEAPDGATPEECLDAADKAVMALSGEDAEPLGSRKRRRLEDGTLALEGTFGPRDFRAMIFFKPSDSGAALQAAEREVEGYWNSR